MANLTTRDPFTGAVTGEFHYDTWDEAQKKLAAVKAAQTDWARLSLTDRLHYVQEGLKYFDLHREDIARDICEQMGRPLHYARGELNGFFERAEYLCAIAEKTLSPDKLEGKEGFYRAIEHVPFGVIFVISAWNYPLLITVNSVVPALIAGNTVLLKHSSLTPKIGQHFEKAFGRLGGQENLLRQVIVDHEITGRLIEEGPVDHVVFTGSVHGGREILRHTSKKFMAPALELGGKDAAYVHEDADIQQAVETIVDGAMYNSGQSCCGIERAYVHEKVYPEFVTRAQELVEQYRIGDPKDPATTLGPLAQAKSANVMLEQVEEARKKGAKVLVGGSTQKIGKGTFFQPTLLVDVHNEMKIMRDENFGPILPVMKVTDVSEALNCVNDSEYGLTAAIFTRDMKIAEEFAQQVEVGTVFMNRCDYLDPALPWTGVKWSGCGSTLSKYGFFNVTRRKAWHFRKPKGKEA